MDQLTEMRVFVHAIERGTFAGAAGVMDLTPSAVSKLIARLEARLGVRLVNRTTRKLSLIAEGETYFVSGRRLIDAVDGLEHEVSASAGEPRGLLRVHTAVSFGVQHLAPAMIDFQRRYPKVRINMSLSDRAINLHGEQIDVALRVGPLSDSSLMSRKVGEVGRVICASPRYLDEFGVPKVPEDLADHRCIVSTVAGRGRWAFKTASGGIEQREVTGTFATDSHDCMLQLAGRASRALPISRQPGRSSPGRSFPSLPTTTIPTRRRPSPFSRPARRRFRRCACSSTFSSSASAVPAGRRATRRGRSRSA